MMVVLGTYHLRIARRFSLGFGLAGLLYLTFVQKEFGWFLSLQGYNFTTFTEVVMFPIHYVVSKSAIFDPFPSCVCVLVFCVMFCLEHTRKLNMCNGGVLSIRLLQHDILVLFKVTFNVYGCVRSISAPFSVSNGLYPEVIHKIVFVFWCCVCDV